MSRISFGFSSEYIVLLNESPSLKTPLICGLISLLLGLLSLIKIEEIYFCISGSSYPLVSHNCFTAPPTSVSFSQVPAKFKVNVICFGTQLQSIGEEELGERVDSGVMG